MPDKPKPAQEPALTPLPPQAEDAYIVVSNNGHTHFGIPGLTYNVLDEEEPRAFTSLDAAAQHLAYVHREMYDAEDARLYRLVPVDEDDYKELYAAATRDLEELDGDDDPDT